MTATQLTPAQLASFQRAFATVLAEKYPGTRWVPMANTKEQQR